MSRKLDCLWLVRSNARMTNHAPTTNDNEWNEMNPVLKALTRLSHSLHTSFSSLDLLPCALAYNEEGTILFTPQPNRRYRMTKTPSDAEDDDRFVIVTTTYPSTYGCYRGRSWSKADMICNSHVEVSKKKYASYESAVKGRRESDTTTTRSPIMYLMKKMTSLHMIQQSWEILMPM